MAGCNAPCKCPTFREHALGVNISGAAMPTRSNTAKYDATEKQWDKDFEAYKRLDKDHGIQLQKMDGAADIESRATEKIELKMGKVLGEKAKLHQEIASEAGIV